MIPSSLATLIQRFRKAGAADSLDDDRLLRRFVEDRDEAAFEVLLWRHGPMVLSVCRRLLGRGADADDAFQATFLALVRKAAGIRNPAALAGWLYRVAHRIALELRKERLRRPSVELDEVACFDAEPDDVPRLVQEEVHRLPKKYREVVVLCYLQGRETAEAAEMIGCPRGTVLSRLATARDRLRSRLFRRGVALGAALALLQGGADASVLSAELVAQARRGALALVTGKHAMIPPRVLALTTTALRRLSLPRLVPFAVLVLILVLGAGLWLRSVLLRPDKAPVEKDESATASASADAPPDSKPIPPQADAAEFADHLARLKAPDWLTRRKTLQWFASTEPYHPDRATAARALAERLDSGGAFEKQDAARALEKWAGREQTPALARALREKLLPAGTRTTLIRTLGRLRDERAIPALAEMLDNPFEDREAAAALVQIGPAAEPEVLKYLEHERFSSKVSACKVLAEVGASRSLPALRTVLEKAGKDLYPGRLAVAKAARQAIAAVESRSGQAPPKGTKR
jgi:RNA polymerase sigma factor (sigma-70 family)